MTSTKGAAVADLTATIDTHLAAYSESDPDSRLDLIGQVWSEDGALIDPPIDGAGHTGISDMAGAVLSHYPAHRFRRTSGIDEHHSFARYEWELVSPDGAVALAGIDIAEVGDDGLLRRVVGFLGPIPQEA